VTELSLLAEFENVTEFAWFHANSNIPSVVMGVRVLSAVRVLVDGGVTGGIYVHDCVKVGVPPLHPCGD